MESSATALASLQGREDGEVELIAELTMAGTEAREGEVREAPGGEKT